MTNQGIIVAGVDEAGRGPLAGPVIAAAVILNSEDPVEGLMDSKKLTPKRRHLLESEIKQRSLAWSVARADVHEIDELNILHATMLAMKRAVESLIITPQHVQVDGNRCPNINISVEAIVKGDQSESVISAASILAKEARDREMIEMDALYPGYGFAIHKGYPTKAHITALSEIGICPIHRRSYGPVQKYMV